MKSNIDKSIPLILYIIMSRHNIDEVKITREDIIEADLSYKNLYVEYDKITGELTINSKKKLPGKK